MSEARIIGHEGQIPWRSPADLQHFRRQTLGKPVIMGRVTFEGLKAPLSGRRNLVLSRGGLAAEGIEVCASLPEALARTQGAPEVMVMGGQAVYEAALPYAHEAILTVIEGDFEGDRCFPALEGWDCVERWALEDPRCRVERWVTRFRGDLPEPRDQPDA